MSAPVGNRTPADPGVCITCTAPMIATKSGSQFVCTRCDYFEFAPGHVPTAVPPIVKAAMAGAVATMAAESRGSAKKPAAAAKPAKAPKAGKTPTPAPTPAPAAKTPPAAAPAPVVTKPAKPTMVAIKDLLAEVMARPFAPIAPVVSKSTKSKKGKWTSDLHTEMHRMGRRLRFYADTFVVNKHPQAGSIAQLLDMCSNVVDGILPQVDNWSKSHDGVWPEPRTRSNGDAPKAAKTPKADRAPKATADKPVIVMVDKSAPTALAVGTKVFIKGSVPKGIALVATRAELDALVIREIAGKKAGVQAGADGVRFSIELAKLEAS